MSQSLLPVSRFAFRLWPFFFVTLTRSLHSSILLFLSRCLLSPFPLQCQELLVSSWIKNTEVSTASLLLLFKWKLRKGEREEKKDHLLPSLLSFFWQNAPKNVPLHTHATFSPIYEVVLKVLGRLLLLLLRLLLLLLVRFFALFSSTYLTLFSHVTLFPFDKK